MEHPLVCSWIMYREKAPPSTHASRNHLYMGYGRIILSCPRNGDSKSIYMTLYPIRANTIMWSNYPMYLGLNTPRHAITIACIIKGAS